jgi:hypothetical protein
MNNILITYDQNKTYIEQTLMEFPTEKNLTRLSGPRSRPTTPQIIW